MLIADNSHKTLIFVFNFFKITKQFRQNLTLQTCRVPVMFLNCILTCSPHNVLAVLVKNKTNFCGGQQRKKKERKKAGGGLGLKNLLSAPKTSESTTRG